MRTHPNYFFGPDHQVELGDLLDATLITHERLDGPNYDLPAVYKQLEQSIGYTERHVPRLLIKDAEDSSETDVILLQTPYANRVTPVGSADDVRNYINGDTSIATRINSNSWNMATKHYFLHEVLKTAGICDVEGKTLPIMVLPSPSGDHNRKYNHVCNAQIRSGDFSPYALDSLDAVREAGYGRIQLIGYSLGAMFARSVVEKASFKNLDVSNVTMVEPTLVNGLWKTIKAYTNIGDRQPSPDPIATTDEQKVGSWIDGSPKLITNLTGTRSGWINNILSAPKNNLDLLLGLTKPEKFRDFIRNGIGKQPGQTNGLMPVTLAYSAYSRMSVGFEKLITESPALATLKKLQLLQILKADGHNAIKDQHGFGEHHLYYVDVMARGIVFGQKK